MDRNTVINIIKCEQLTSFNLFEDRADAADEIIIKKVSDRWVVYATNERAGMISGSEAVFEDEEAALFNFIRRLMALNRVINSYKP